MVLLAAKHIGTVYQHVSWIMSPSVVFIGYEQNQTNPETKLRPNSWDHKL